MLMSFTHFKYGKSWHQQDTGFQQQAWHSLRMPVITILRQKLAVERSILKSVVTGFHTVRQFANQGIIVQIMRHVGQNRASRLQSLGPLQRFSDVHMSRMWLAPQCINHQGVQSGQHLSAVGWYRGHVRTERNVADAISHDWQFAMVQANWEPTAVPAASKA